LYRADPLLDHKRGAVTEHLVLPQCKLRRHGCLLAADQVELVLQVRASTALSDSQFTIHNSQFAIHNSQFTIHISQFTIRNSQFTIHNSQFTIHISYSTIHSSQFHNSTIPQFTTHDSQFTIHNSQFTIHNPKLFFNFTTQDVKPAQAF
jgi:hypothetical protein